MRRSRKSTTQRKKFRQRLIAPVVFTEHKAQASRYSFLRNISSRLISILFSRPLIGALLLIVGTILVTSPFSPSQAPAEQEGYSTPPTVKKNSVDFGPIKIADTLRSAEQVSQPPLRIVVPKFAIDLPVVEAPVEDGVWEVSETTASHGVGSANPGTIGNTVIFAHARDGLFGPLRKIQKDDLIYVLTKDRWFRYQVKETKEVSPKQVTDVAPTKTEVLTLFTCSGFLDGKRLIVSAVPYRP